MSRRRLRPSSLRTRIVAVFAAGSTILLVLTGGVLYVSFNSQLDAGINQALRDRAGEIAADVRDGSVALRPGEAFAALLHPDGTVLDATFSSEGRAPILSPRDLARARVQEIVTNRRHVTGLGDRARILARPAVAAGDGQVVVVVGESLDTVIDARKRLGLLLAVLSPLLIGIIAWCGWVLAGAALRPVRRMTLKADAIGGGNAGERLPQPPGDDELAHLGRTLNAMLGRVEASLAHERAFVDDASHELRTPVSILRGELELARAEPADREAVERALTSALQEAERLGRLTEDLLVLARADRTDLTLGRESVDCLAAAVSALERLRAAGGPELRATGQPVEVLADPGLLDRVIDNLVANARRHAVAAVAVEVAAVEGWCRLTVDDDGAGFPTAFLPVAFDRFTRSDADRGRDHGGTGLGLAIVAAVTRAQGGRVEATNRSPLGGARVTVWLPLAADQQPDR